MGRRMEARGEALAGAPTVEEIRALARSANESELAALERSLAADTRKGVRAALATARRRVDAECAERERLSALYEFEASLCAERDATVCVGLDEVGRGPLAGPLAVGAVVLSPDVRISGLNDSKQVAPHDRERIADEVKRTARAWTVVYVEPAEIDARGMSSCLRMAFSKAIDTIDRAIGSVDLVLIDGNPVHCDPREVTIVKGDSACASIAAASIIAKVDRDALMERYAIDYPEYGFDSNKGYASAEHIAAIERYGLSPIHRASFCTAFNQPSLF